MLGKKMKKGLCLLLVAVMLVTLMPSAAFAVEAAVVEPLAFRTEPMISATNEQTTALKSNGTVWTWGVVGAAGPFSPIISQVPVQVPSLDNVTALATGNRPAALRNDGTIWTWEANRVWSGGIQTIQFESSPVEGINDVVAIATGTRHTVALRNDGTVWTWGENRWGQLGDGTTEDRPTPGQVSGLSNVIAIAASQEHTVALRSDGTVWAWGSNGNFQLGIGGSQSRLTPVQMEGINNVTAIAAPRYATIALRSDGTVWAWGSNTNGRLGDGTTQNPRGTPVQAVGLNDVTAIAASAHTAAIRNDGTLWVWGWNGWGQLGDGTTQSRHTPIQVEGFNDVVAVTTGADHTVAMRSDGTVWAWGGLRSGILGDGTEARSYVPVQVLGPDGVGYLNLGEGSPGNGDLPIGDPLLWAEATAFILEHGRLLYQPIFEGRTYYIYRLEGLHPRRTAYDEIRMYPSPGRAFDFLFESRDDELVLVRRDQTLQRLGFLHFGMNDGCLSHLAMCAALFCTAMCAPTHVSANQRLNNVGGYMATAWDMRSAFGYMRNQHNFNEHLSGVLSNGISFIGTTAGLAIKPIPTLVKFFGEIIIDAAVGALAQEETPVPTLYMLYTHHAYAWSNLIHISDSLDDALSQGTGAAIEWGRFLSYDIAMATLQVSYRFYVYQELHLLASKYLDVQMNRGNLNAQRLVDDFKVAETLAPLLVPQIEPYVNILKLRNTLGGIQARVVPQRGDSTADYDLIRLEERLGDHLEALQDREFSDQWRSVWGNARIAYRPISPAVLARTSFGQMSPLLDQTTLLLDQTIIVQSSANIIVHDRFGNLIGEIVDDVVVYYSGSEAVSPFVAMVLDSTKVLLLPHGYDYTIEITATDYGFMDYREFRINSLGDVISSTTTNGVLTDPGDVFTVNTVVGVEDYGLVLVGGEAINAVITAKADGDGTVYATGNGVVIGDTVTVAGRPNDGFRFDGWFENGVRVSTETIYVFTATNNRTLTARFIPDSGDSPLPFTDVSSTNWFYPYVRNVFQRNIMRGASATTFDPAGDFNREQVVATLFRMYHGRLANASDPSATPFADVDPGGWYAPYIAWAFGAGIVTGQTATTFGTGDAVTRQDFAVLMHRFANFTGADTGIPVGFMPQFPDAENIGSWAQDALAWAVYARLITGTGEGFLLPWETATRAEAAAILMRYIQAFGDITYSPPPPTEASFDLRDLLGLTYHQITARYGHLLGPSDTDRWLPDGFGSWWAAVDGRMFFGDVGLSIRPDWRGDGAPGPDPRTHPIVIAYSHHPMFHINGVTRNSSFADIVARQGPPLEIEDTVCWGSGDPIRIYTFRDNITYHRLLTGESWVEMWAIA
ncbi:MAG: S-layer homology domain-containing protein [Oscillospiraceae bacterium]|nr:S-layer homology domain-containing protein [Oscillospiraceae bacterium]